MNLCRVYASNNNTFYNNTFIDHTVSKDTRVMKKNSQSKKAK